MEEGRGGGKGCAKARAFIHKQSLPARIVGWVRFTSRSAERRARKEKVVGRSPLSRVLLRIPMHRFPAYRWGEWKLGATQERVYGPVVGEMVIMVWDNSAARKALPLDATALEALGWHFGPSHQSGRWVGGDGVPGVTAAGARTKLASAAYGGHWRPGIMEGSDAESGHNGVGQQHLRLDAGKAPQTGEGGSTHLVQGVEGLCCRAGGLEAALWVGPARAFVRQPRQCCCSYSRLVLLQLQ